jgi:hypothetical protein
MTGKSKIIIFYQGDYCNLTEDRCQWGTNPACPDKDKDCKWFVRYEDLPKEEE